MEDGFAELLTQQPTTMKLQVYTERCFTTTGLLIASFVYVFLLVSAALYIPLPGAHSGVNILSLLDSRAHVFARRSLRGQLLVHANTTDSFNDTSVFTFPQRPTVQILSTFPNLETSSEMSSQEIAGRRTGETAPAFIGSGEALSGEGAFPANTYDDSKQDPLDSAMFESKTDYTRQDAPGLGTAIYLGAIPYVMIAVVVFMSFR